MVEARQVMSSHPLEHQLVEWFLLKGSSDLYSIIYPAHFIDE